MWDSLQKSTIPEGRYCGSREAILREWESFTGFSLGHRVDIPSADETLRLWVPPGGTTAAALLEALPSYNFRIILSENRVRWFSPMAARQFWLERIEEDLPSRD